MLHLHSKVLQKPIKCNEYPNHICIVCICPPSVSAESSQHISNCFAIFKSDHALNLVVQADE